MADASLVEILSRSRDDVWDLGESMTDSRLWASPLGRFVARVNDASQSQRAMQLLAFFAARRALACWQIYCDGSNPFDGVKAAERVLSGHAPTSVLRSYLEPAVPSFRGTPIADCRVCDTRCAAASVAHMARFIGEGNPRDVAICLSSADMAFDHSPLGPHDQFRRWLIEVAVPAALDERDLTDEESCQFRDYSTAELDVERETSGEPVHSESTAPQRPWWRFW